MVQRGVGESALRAELAAETARLLAEEGMNDWGFAKVKAKQRLGATRSLLPSNLEVAAALQSYLQTFMAEETAARLLALRQAARSLMRVLAEFQPLLAGPALSGLATPTSLVELHLFSDPPEKVDIFLANAGRHYEDDERRVRHPDGREQIVPSCVLEASAEVEVELLLFGEADRRWSPVSPVDGRPMQRWDIKALDAALAE